MSRKNASVKDMTGQKVGKWTVIDRAPNRGERVYWNCVCTCGTVREVLGQNLRDGQSLNCGCERNYIGNPRHGKSDSKVWRAWKAMKQRCKGYDERSRENYLERGIGHCEEWEIFENFYADMGEPPSPLHTLDRIDNDKGYSKENCRWATVSEQNSNKRRCTASGGKTQRQIAKELGIDVRTLRLRKRHGKI